MNLEVGDKFRVKNSLTTYRVVARSASGRLFLQDVEEPTAFSSWDPDAGDTPLPIELGPDDGALGLPNLPVLAAESVLGAVPAQEES